VFSRALAGEEATEDTWSVPGREQWQLRLTRDGTAGSFQFSRWDEERTSWVPAEEITWAAGHGRWSTMGANGTIGSARSW
jgi:hypothetical protein